MCGILVCAGVFCERGRGESGVCSVVWERAVMEFLPEFLASSCCKEFVAGGFGGMAGVISGSPSTLLGSASSGRQLGTHMAGRSP